jgi:hypothetical protein
MSNFMPPNVSSLTCFAYQPRGELMSENSGRCARQNDLFAAPLGAKSLNSFCRAARQSGAVA